MKTNHTKGEWKVREVRAYKNELVYTRIDSDNKTLGFAGVYCDDKRKISINEAKANAKLIAAAPELLEAIEEFMSYWESDFFRLESKDARTQSAWLAKASQAIIKATE